MKCPNCQHENHDEAKFCNDCGTALSEAKKAATQDDRFSLITDYVPAELKERIIDAGRQLESERRFVTVLFADVSGFTSLSEKLDPETVTMVMNDLFNGLITIIIKYEGLIIDFFGDGILAVFGAPLAHENDPERAIRSAIEMMPYIDQFNKVSPHKLPAPLGMHIGIHSGLVVVGNVGNDLRMRYSAVGDTVNLCSRIADHATRGEVYISDNTYKLLPAQLNTEPAESVRLKGKEEPVTVHKLLSIEDEAVGEFAAGGKGFVGRREEKEIISQALSRVLEKKEERLLVCGEPGVGKSRLKDELVANALSKGFSVFEGKCSSFETKTPYYLWNTLLKNMFGISVEASENETRKQLHDTLAILSMNEEEPYLATLLSLRYEEILLEDDQGRRHRIFEAMHKLIAKFSERQPTAFILEDIHWADRFSKELLEFLMNKDELAPSFFYIIFRPEYTEYKNIMNRGQLINLDRLSEEDTLELIKLRLNVNEVPDELLQLIKVRTEGNPFFIEESLKTLVENEFISVKKGKLKLDSENLESGVPDTVQGVVMARIDRLEGRIRDVLLNASVIGREFSRRLVERVINGEGEVLTSLSHLKGLELILEREEVQEFEYLFKHYMIQEVAYNTILINKRKKLHGMIANAIEEIYEDRLKGLYELLAFHYEKAEQWEKAAEYYGRAGRKVREIYTEEESKDLFDKKNYAIEKIYEAKPKKGLIAKTFLGIGIFAYFFVYFGVIIGCISNGDFSPSTYLSSAFEEGGFVRANWDIMSLLMDIFIIVFVSWCYQIIPFFLLSIFLQKIKLFDLMNDRLEIVKGDNKRFSILFSDIKSIIFYGKEKGSLIRYLYKEADQHKSIGADDKSSIFTGLKTFRFTGMMPYSIGIGGSSLGSVYIVRKSGFNLLKILIPWLNTLEKSKNYMLHPSDPKEFFDQLHIAYEKWKRANVKSQSEG
ncbi:adenylate/guanylate cyclase domain-containing protein [Thermodesulfobacteriota bacterium]